MKNEVFNGQRFWNWFKYDMKQMWRNQMKAALGIGFSGLIFYALAIMFNLVIDQAWQGPSGAGRALVFVFALVALQLYQTKTYGFLTDKSKGSAWLMAPASTLEKWVSMMIMTLIVIPVLFFVAYLGVDWLLCTVDHSCGVSMISAFADALSQYSAAYEAGDTLISIGSAVWFIIASFCLNFLYFLLCGIVFKKHKILYAIAITFCLSMVFSLVFGQVLGVYSSDAADLFTSGSQAAQTSVYVYSVISTVLALCLAGANYYRLKTIKH